MISQKSPVKHDDKIYEAAFRRAAADLARVKNELRLTRDQTSALERKIEQLARVIDDLSRMVPVRLVEEVRNDLVRNGSVATIERSVRSPIYTKLLETLSSAPQREWEVNQVNNALSKAGFSLGGKEVATILGRLARQGAIVRVGRGMYRTNGALIVTSDELGGFAIRDDE